jgi:hypothetical protein
LLDLLGGFNDDIHGTWGNSCFFSELGGAWAKHFGPGRHLCVACEGRLWYKARAFPLCVGQQTTVSHCNRR